MKKFAVVFLLSGVCAVLCLVFYSTRPACFNDDSKPEEKSHDARNDRIRDELLRITHSFEAGNRALWKEFQTETDRGIREKYIQAHNSVSACAARLSEFSVCGKLVYKSAKDRITGSHDFDDAFEEIVREPIEVPCVLAHEEVSDRLRNLELRLRENHRDFLCDLAAFQETDEVKSALDPEELRRLGSGLQSAKEKALELHFAKSFAVAGTILELVFLRETARCIVRVLGPMIAKATATASVSTICACADGPIPIGDAIGFVLGVGGLAWTGYDLYQVSKVLPEELRAELENGLVQSERQLRADTEKTSLMLLAQYDNAGKNLYARLCAQLKEK